MSIEHIIYASTCCVQNKNHKLLAIDQHFLNVTMKTKFYEIPPYIDNKDSMKLICS